VLAVTNTETNWLCVECGQPLVGRSVTIPTRTPYPWWSWLLVALGVALVALYAPGVEQAQREQALTRPVLQSLPEWGTHLEGRSSQQTGLEAHGALDFETRYLAAEREVNRDGPVAMFGVGLIVVGSCVLSRKWVLNHRSSDGQIGAGGESNALASTITRGLLDAWAVAETLAMSAVYLIAFACGYLVVGRILAGQPPTLEVMQETLETVLQAVSEVRTLVA
jgi:hypothetical protein